MKKVIFKLFAPLLMVLLIVTQAGGQLPLLQGDAVVTHSPTPNSSVVVRIVHTNNTTTAPLGSNWYATTMSPSTPVGLKPVNDFYSNSNSSLTNGLGNV